jgi:hypothetical protein
LDNKSYLARIHFGLFFDRIGLFVTQFGDFFDPIGRFFTQSVWSHCIRAQSALSTSVILPFFCENTFFLDRAIQEQIKQPNVLVPGCRKNGGAGLPDGIFSNKNPNLGIFRTLEWKR